MASQRMHLNKQPYNSIKCWPYWHFKHFRIELVEFYKFHELQELCHTHLLTA